MSSCPSFKSIFIFSINSLILSGLPFILFHLAEASLSDFWWIYTLMYAAVQKYYEISLFYNYSHFYYSFCNQPVSFAQLENINQLWNNNCAMHVNKRFKNKNKIKSCNIQIDNLAHKKCNVFIKGWHHCLTSVSKGGFLVNNHSLDPQLLVKGEVNFNYIFQREKSEKIKKWGERWKYSSGTGLLTYSLQNCVMHLKEKKRYFQPALLYKKSHFKLSKYFSENIS